MVLDQSDQLKLRKKDKSWKGSAKAEEVYTYDDVLTAAGFVRCLKCEMVFQMALWDCPSCGWTRP